MVESEFGDVASKTANGRFDYTVSDPLGPISGFTNYTPAQMRVVSIWKSKLAELFKVQGFTPMDPRPVELACNLQTAGGMEKQIYGISRLQDGSLTKLGIPFDRTVPMALMIAQHYREMKFPYARSDIGWAFRGEHASQGRYRAFIQADADIIDEKLTARSDVQCIVAVIKGIQTLGVTKCNVFLNHIGIARDFLREANIAPEKYKDALRAIDKLKPDNEAEVVEELCQNVPGLGKDEALTLLKNMSYRGPLSGFKFPNTPSAEALAAFEHLVEIERIAILMGIPEGMLQFAPNLTRGLDYYTGVVFETFIPGKEKYGSVASGGRYDDLIGGFNDKVKLQGVGGSIGLTRLFDVMQAENLVDLSKQTTAQVFVGYRTKECMDKAIEVSTALQGLGVYTELHTSDLNVKKQITLADKKGIPCAIFVMNPDEIILKEMWVKKDSEGRTPQHTFKSVEEAANFVKGLKEAGTFEEGQVDFAEATELKS